MRNTMKAVVIHEARSTGGLKLESASGSPSPMLAKFDPRQSLWAQPL